jgi:peptidoglycan/LPS O-acetylase OafA/YrhL
MNRVLSVYLDVVRFAAAVAVIVAHLSFEHISGKLVPWYPAGFGDVAVAVFFVLSGYVIAHVFATRERDWKSYMVSRLSRLYSVVLVGVAVTLLLDTAGAWIDPAFYGGKFVHRSPPSVTGYVASTLLVNEWHVFNFGGIAPGSNGPWWSLSFEATYYLAAGLILFAPRVLGIAVALVVLAMSGITIAALFPLWGLGYWLYSVRPGQKTSLGLALFIVGGGLLLIFPYVAWRIPQLPITLSFGRGNYQRHLLADYYSGGAFALHLLGAQMLFARVKTVPAAFERFSRWIGSMTFPLYLLHAPMLPFFAVVLPFERASAAQVLSIAALVFLLAALLTPVCDRLKLQLRSLGATRRPSPANVQA